MGAYASKNDMQFEVSNLDSLQRPRGEVHNVFEVAREIYNGPRDQDKEFSVRRKTRVLKQ